MVRLLIALAIFFVLGLAFTAVYKANKKVPAPAVADEEALCEGCKEDGHCKLRI